MFQALPGMLQKKGLCIEIPTYQIEKGGMLERLEDRVVMYLGDSILYGLVKWYNVENGFFKVGIELERGFPWKMVGRSGTGCLKRK